MMDEILIEVRKNCVAIADGAQDSDLKHLGAWLAKYFNTDIPDGYSEFLGKCNGFLTEKRQMYGLSNEQTIAQYPLLVNLDFYFKNKNLAELWEMREYVVFGASDLEYFAYHISSRTFRILTSDILYVTDSFGCFEQAFESFML